MATRAQTAIPSSPTPRASTRPPALASVSARPLAVAALLGASAIGVTLAVSLPLGLALLAVVCFGTLALINLQIGVTLWIPLMFLQAVPALNLAGKGAGAVIALVWLSSLRARKQRSTWALVRYRRLLEVIVLLLVWLSLSLLWAPVAREVLDDVWRWYALGLLFVVVMSSVSTTAAIRLMISAFVAGAVVSLAAGWLTTGFSPQAGARLEGTQGDPNILAASLVAGVVLASALMTQTRSALVRWLLVVSVAWLLLGLAATESRGGLVAAAIALVAAAVFFRSQRGYVVTFAVVVVTVISGFFAASPSAWQRVTTVNGGTGRSDIWTVAWRIARENPVIGIGLNNFQVVAPDYVREPGLLTRVDLIADHPHVVHNMYLEVFTETGIVGLSLFLLLVGWCLRAAWLAGRRFERVGQPTAAVLARAVLVASIAMLGASIFLSSQDDLRLWFLLALGPASLLVAELQRDAGDPPKTPGRPASQDART